MSQPPPTGGAKPDDGSVRVDASGRVSGFDEAFARMVGRPPERILGERLCELLAPDLAHLRERQELMDQVESLVASLQDAIEARDEFLGIASHELKTPLTSLQLQLDGLLRAAAKGNLALLPPLPEKLQAIGRQTRRLGQLVNDLLDVSRIRSGRLDLKLEPVDLAQVAADAAERFRQEAGQAGSELSLTTAGPVVGPWDRNRLEQVVGNLISNAIKYGRSRPIAVRVGRGGSTGRLEVEDQGIGIPAGEEERIFERFERAVPHRHYGGMGLGLWITREIVTRLGGRVAARSVAGEGSTFTVELPLGGEMEPRTGP